MTTPIAPLTAERLREIEASLDDVPRWPPRDPARTLLDDTIALLADARAMREEVARLKEHAIKHIQSNAAIRDVLARANAPRKPGRHPSEHITLSEAVEELAIHCEALRAALEKAEREANSMRLDADRLREECRQAHVNFNAAIVRAEKAEAGQLHTRELLAELYKRAEKAERERQEAVNNINKAEWGRQEANNRAARLEASLTAERERNGHEVAEQRHLEMGAFAIYAAHRADMTFTMAKREAETLIAVCREPVAKEAPTPTCTCSYDDSEEMTRHASLCPLAAQEFALNAAIAAWTRRALTAEDDAVALRTALAAVVAVVERAQRAQLNIGVLSSLEALHMTYLLDAILEPDDAVRATLPGAEWLGGTRG